MTDTMSFTVNYVALSSANLPNINSGTPSNCCPSTGCNVFPYSNFFSLDGLYGTAIQGLNGETVLSVLNDPKYFSAKVTSIETNMSGTHYYDCSEGSIVNLALVDNSNNNAAFYNFTDTPDGDFSSTSNIDINETLTNPPLLSGYRLSLDTNGAGCCRYAFVLSLVFTLTIEVTFCTGERVEQPRCVNYCLVAENLTSCFPQYWSFCLNTTNSNGDPNIVTSTGCQDFFQKYIAEKGPDKRIDDVLQNYCKKYAGFEDLLNSRNQTDIELCACNLEPQLYDELRTSLINLFPGYASVSEDSRCLFPQCVDSPYKNTNTTAICQIPNCLNIASITNSGQVGGITIIQGATGCGNITGQGGTGTTGPTGPTGTNPPGQKSWWEKNWLWVVLGIGILIVFIVIMLIVIAGESNKKKPQVKLERDFI